MMKTIQTGFVVCEEEEKKSYESDEGDEAEVWQNGFSSARKPKFSTTSTLTAQDVGTQQMIFDRLPLSQSNRAIFFKWLLEEERKKNDVATDLPTSGSSQGDDERVQEAVPDS